MQRRTSRSIAVLASLAIVAAACGSDDDGGDSGASTTAASGGASTTEGGADTTAGGAETTEGGAETTEGAERPRAETTEGGAETTEGGTRPPRAAASRPKVEARPARPAARRSTRRSTRPAATVPVGRSPTCSAPAKLPCRPRASPIVIGFQNPEGDPNGSFPEATLAAEAAVEYINNELGGWGSDIQNGVPGRPIQLEVCKTAIAPDDSQRCANELVSKDPFMIVSTINFFGNHLPIFEAAGIPAIVTVPVTIADYTSPASYAIAAGGGCLGAHTALVEFATTDLEATRVAVPWADTPPGVVCYYDLEAKPLDVLKGTVPGDSRAGRHDPRPRVHRRPDQAGDARRDPAGHRGPRLRPGRDHLLRPGRRLLEPGRRARSPGLDAREHPARPVRFVHRLRGHARRRRRSPTACTSSPPAAR